METNIAETIAALQALADAGHTEVQLQSIVSGEPVSLAVYDYCDSSIFEETHTEDGTPVIEICFD